MIELFQSLNPVSQALIAGIFTWLTTTIGASFVFTAKEISQKIFDLILGFAGGVMIAASFWSLLSPAIEMAKNHSFGAWFPAATGFLLGAIFLRTIDKIIPHLHLGFETKDAEGPKTSWQRSTLLIIAITLHNIPEGLAVGVAFGATGVLLESASLTSAIALAIGIGIQNIPEGFAVSMPLRREGLSRFKSFWYGQLSAVVEPISAVIGAFAVVLITPLLPYALAFSAGAMIFVVVEQVIPESQHHGNVDLSTSGLIIGFLVMMILDVAFG